MNTVCVALALDFWRRRKRSPGASSSGPDVEVEDGLDLRRVPASAARRRVAAQRQLDADLAERALLLAQAQHQLDDGLAIVGGALLQIGADRRRVPLAAAHRHQVVAA